MSEGQKGSRGALEALFPDVQAMLKLKGSHPAAHRAHAVEAVRENRQK